MTVIESILVKNPGATWPEVERLLVALMGELAARWLRAATPPPAAALKGSTAGDGGGT